MFRSKTVFVVGAGASCEAGLPSGNDLKQQIARILDIRFDRFSNRLQSGDYRIVHALNRHTGGQLANINPYLPKAHRIAEAMPAAISIDNYLDAHRGDAELELCGKLAIVKSILDAEAASGLRRLEPHDDGFDAKHIDETWYLKFLRLLTEGVRKENVAAIFDNVAIVVFNYDRCIERYLLQAIKGYYDLSNDEAVKVVSGLRIYHPYGQVGQLPWQGGHGVAFGAADTAELLEISHGIKTFTEGQDDEAVMTPILEMMSEAETVVFLGFAYHQQNLDLITPPRSFASRVFGTALGISNSDQRAVTASLRQMLQPVEGEIEVNLHPSRCAGLFDEFWRSLSAPAPGQ